MLLVKDKTICHTANKAESDRAAVKLLTRTGIRLGKRILIE